MGNRTPIISALLLLENSFYIKTTLNEFNPNPGSIRQGRNYQPRLA